MVLQYISYIAGFMTSKCLAPTSLSLTFTLIVSGVGMARLSYANVFPIETLILCSRRILKAQAATIGTLKKPRNQYSTLSKPLPQPKTSPT